MLTSTGDQAFVPLGGTERLTLNANAVLRPGGPFRLDYNVFVQDFEGQPYDHARKYVPDGVRTVTSRSQTHVLGARFAAPSGLTFGDLSYSYLRDRNESSLYEDPTDSRFVPATLAGQAGSNAFALGGNDLGAVIDRLTETHTVVASVTSQVGAHLVKAGGQTRLHRLDNEQFGILVDEVTGQAGVNPNPATRATLDVSPVEAALYVQDRVELENLIVNAGLRFDYFDSDFEVPVDPSQADSLFILTEAGERVSNRRPADVKLQLSPRFGIAFPISATGVLRFSAGLFFQTPQFNLLYTNPEFLSRSGRFGNAELEPERTLAFEIGVQQGFTDDLAAEVTVFSKDIRNLIGEEVLLTPQGEFVSRWTNVDVGTVRGITAVLTQRPVDGLSFAADYTLQFAEGTASNPGEAFVLGESGEREEVRLVRLDWDRRHVFSGTLTYAPPAGVLRGLTVTSLNRLQSGTPYTSIRDGVRAFVKNNDDQPLIFTSDLRAFYRLPFLGGAEALVQVTNLFDTQVQNFVYADTGLATETVQEARLRQSGFVVRGVNTLDDFFYRPTFFGAPRRASLGLRVRL